MAGVAEEQDAFSSSFQSNCNCVFNLLTRRPDTPEAAGEHHYDPNYNPAFSWTSTLSNRILIEAGVSAQNLDQNDTRAGGLSGNEQGSDLIIRITDQGLNLSYGAPTATRSVPRRQYQERFALSYITGSHSVKVGHEHPPHEPGQCDRRCTEQVPERPGHHLPLQQRHAQSADAL